MNKKTLLIIGSVFLAVVVVVVVVLLRSPGSLRINNEPILSRQYGDVAHLPNNHLRFFNGRQFINYNPFTGETTHLYEEIELPGVTKAKWSANGELVAIQTVFLTRNDRLGRYLEQRGLPLDEVYWWLFDLGGDSFTLLPSDVNDMLWSGNELYAHIGSVDRSHRDGEHTRQPESIQRVDLDGSLSTIGNINDNLHRFLRATPQGVFYLSQTRGGYSLKSMNNQGEVEQYLTLPSDDVTISFDGTYVVYPALSDNEGDDTGHSHSDEGGFSTNVNYEIYSTNEKSKLKTLRDFKDSALVEFSYDSEYLFIAEKNDDSIDLFTYKFETDKGSLVVGDTDPEHTGSLATIGISSHSADFMLLESANFYYAIGSSAGGVEPPKLFLSERLYQGDGYVITQANSGSNINLIAVNMYVQERDRIEREVFKTLRDQGINPDLFDILFEEYY